MSLRRAWLTCRLLLFAQVRQQPARLLTMMIVIAASGALGNAVFLVNDTALGEFSAAARRIVGNADIVIRGSGAGFAESLYPQIAKDPRVDSAAPLLELRVALPDRAKPLKILGIDVFKSSSLQPALFAATKGDIRAMFAPLAIVLNSVAARDLEARAGDGLRATSADHELNLRVLAVMAEADDTAPFAIMDIASAQWSFGSLGRLNRVDVRLKPGELTGRFLADWTPKLPPGTVMATGDTERSRAANATRAYRVNLNMLALISVLTSAFLVYSIQASSLLRRRVSIGILRALGVSQRELRAGLNIEAVLLGSVGSAAGIALGIAVAALLLRKVGGDFGNGQLHAVSNFPLLDWRLLALSFVIGVLIVGISLWIPAREATRREPARALKSGDSQASVNSPLMRSAGTALLAAGGVLSFVPTFAGMPVAGYLAIAAILFGSVLWIPAASIALFRRIPRTSSLAINLAIAQLRGSQASLFVSLAPLIVSFALMVAMAIMVHSFRDSFDSWLLKLLPSDVQMRIGFGTETASWTQQEQRRVEALPEIARAEFRRTQLIYLNGDQEPVTLIVRDMHSRAATDVLPLIEASTSRVSANAVWISEAVRDTYKFKLDEGISVPIGGTQHALHVAGVWRDYARPNGALVIDRATYIRWTGDQSANEGSFWLAPNASVTQAQRSIRASVRSAAAEFVGSTELRERSLALFDRAFAVTYALEALAVLIGLAGVSIAASFSALTRRAEFGMLRHVGLTRSDVLKTLCAEGLATSLFGMVFGLLLGVVLSLVLIFVVNRQSFHWSIDFVVPGARLVLLAGILVAAGAMTAVISGRSVLREDAVRAVREDW